MDFRRRPGLNEPDSQVSEDGPDHRRVFDAADDPHGALALRTDQGIDFVDLLYQARPVSPKNLFITISPGNSGREEDQAFPLVSGFIPESVRSFFRYLMAETTIIPYCERHVIGLVTVLPPMSAASFAAASR